MRRQLETWRQVIDVDLTGVFNTIRAVGPGMVERHYGRIIATASMMGRTGWPARGWLRVGEVGRDRLGQVRRARFRSATASRSTRSRQEMSTLPMIQNEPIRKLMRPDLENPTREDAAAGFQRLHVLPIPWVQPEEISRAVLFLAAEEAGGISGTVMSIDAGASARVTA